MTGLELLVDDIDGQLHAAVVRKTVLQDLYIDAADTAGAWASLYLGKVTKVDKSLDAAIVDLGNGLSGLLPAKHVHFPGADRSESRTGIAELLKPGQNIAVQIKSEARKGSAHEQHKMARLTTKLNIFGPHLIYCPVANQVTMSRKIEKESLIAFSTKLKGKGGWILQASAETATEEELNAECLRLQEEWYGIIAEKEASEGKPRLLKPAPNAIARAFLDYGEKSFDHIYVANKKIFDLMSAWSPKNAPALATSKRLRLFKPEQPGQKLFDIHDVYSELETLTDMQVMLPSGGSIIIEPVHALIIIDVNQGSSASILDANIEAAREVARQARIRNLSGAILVDFIGLTHRNDKAKVLEDFEKHFADDPSTAQVHGFTRLGIAEVTRKRRSGMHFEKLKRK